MNRLLLSFLPVAALWIAQTAAAALPPLPATLVVSVNNAGAPTAGTTPVDASRVRFSADNRFVVFDSEAPDLVAGDTNGARDVFVRDLQAGTTTRVSVASGGTQGNGDSSHPSISADGRYVVFQSRASNLAASIANPGFSNIYLYDRQTAQTVAITTPQTAANPIAATPDSVNPVISADGRFVAYQSSASNLLDNSLGQSDTNGFDDIYVYSRVDGSTILVSRADPLTDSNGDSTHPDISGDGSFVVFASTADNFGLGDTNGVRDVFVRDVANFSFTADAGVVRLSTHFVGTESLVASDFPSISADGMHVAFVSDDPNLDDPPVVLATPQVVSLYVRDFFFNGSVTKIFAGSSVKPGCSISADGQSVAFESPGADDAHHAQVSVWHRSKVAPQGFVSLVSGAPDGTGGNGLSHVPGMSPDGTVAGFYSTAGNLTGNDSNGAGDVFAAPAASVGFSAPRFAVGRSGLEATLTVVRTSNLDGTLTVTCTTADGTGTVVAGDYIPEQRTLVFAPGVTQKTLDVQIPTRTAPAGDRDFSVKVDVVSGAGTLSVNAQAVVSVLEDQGSAADHLGHGVFVSGTNPDGTLLTFTNPGLQDSFAGKFVVDAQVFVGDGTTNISPALMGGTVGLPAIPAGGSVSLDISAAYTLAPANLPPNPALVFYGLVYEHTPLNGDVLQNAIFLRSVNPDGPSNGVPAPGTGINAPGLTPGIFITELHINGPDAVNEGDAVALTAGGTMSDGSPFTGNPVWSASALAIDAQGGLTTAPVSADTTVTVMATSSLGGATQTASKTITIHHVAVAAGRFEFSSATAAVTETIGSAVLTVNRVGGSIGGAAVDYAVTGGTAVAGKDFTGGSGTLQFSDGMTSQKITIPIIDNHGSELDRTVVFALSNPTGGSALGSTIATTLTITSGAGTGGGLPVVTIVAVDPVAVAGSSQGAVQINRTGGDLTKPLKVALAFKGTAVGGVDYVAPLLKKKIKANETSAQIVIQPIDHPFDVGGTINRVVKVKVKVMPRSAYTVTIPAQKKVRIEYMH